MTIQRGRFAFRRDFDPEGIIRLGGPKRKGGGFGEELSFFRLDDAPKVAEVHGQNPTRLPIMLPSNDPDAVFEDKFELWRGSRKENAKGVLLCHGDGVTCHRMTDEDDPFAREKMPCPTPENCAYAWEHTSAKAKASNSCACGATGRLRVICYRVNIMEIYEVRTGSWNAFKGLRNKLQDILEHPMFGRLTGIPMVLERVAKKNRFGKTNYPVRITTPTWKEMQTEALWMQKAIAKVNEVTFQLPQPEYTAPRPELQAPPSDLRHEAEGLDADDPGPQNREPDEIQGPDERGEDPEDLRDAEVAAEQDQSDSEECFECGRPWPGPDFEESDHPDRCPECGRAPEGATRTSTPGPNARSKKERTERAGQAVASILQKQREAREQEKEDVSEARKERAAEKGKTKSMFQI